MESIFKAKAGPPEREVRLEVVRFGRDYVAFLGGGESHLGALAWEGGALCVYPHKEGPIARALARELEAFLDGQVAVLAGMHFAVIDKAGIEEVQANALLLGRRFKADWQSR